MMISTERVNQEFVERVIEALRPSVAYARLIEGQITPVQSVNLANLQALACTRILIAVAELRGGNAFA
jgi:hypothetical protein